MSVYRNQAEANAALQVLSGVVNRTNAGAPVLVPGAGIADQSLAEGAFVSVIFEASDYFSATGATITYSFLLDDAALPSWLSFDANALAVTGKAPDGSAGAYVLKRTASVVSGGVTYTASDTATITITASNTGPVKIADFADKVIATGVAGSFDIPWAQLFSDPDGDTLTAALQGLDGTALPTGVTYVETTPGLFTVSHTSQASPGGTSVLEIIASDGSVTDREIFNLTFDDAPSGQFDFSVAVDTEVYFDIVSRSDDPVNNLIVPGSVVAAAGSVREAADQKGFFYTRDPSVDTADTFTFTLIDQNSLETDLSGTIDNVATPQIDSDPIALTRTQGSATTIDLNSYFRGGVGGVDPAGFRFEDALGADLGTSLSVTNVWAPVISSLGILTPNFVAAFTGNAPTVFIRGKDRAGNPSEFSEPLDYTITPSSGTAPFPDPGKPGYGPTVCFNFDYQIGHVGARMAANLAKELFLLFRLGDSTKGALARVAEGSLNQQTGIMTVPAGWNKIVGQIRWVAQATKGNRPDLDTGVWSILADVTGTARIQAKGANAFTQISANRWEKTFTASDTGAVEIMIDGGAAGGTINLGTAYIGLKSEEGQLWKEGAGEYRDLISRGHCVRVLDGGHGVGGAKIVRTSDVATFSDLIWSNTQTNGAKRGQPLSTYLDFAKGAEIGIWWPCPWPLGAGVIETELYQAQTGSQIDATIPIVEANASVIFPQMEIEHDAYADYICDEMDQSGWPEHLLFRGSVGNEVFNTLGGFRPHYAYELGYGKGLRVFLNSSVPSTLTNGYSNGVQAASLARALQTKFAVRRPNQHWVMSVDCHTAGGGTLTLRQLKGIADYNARSGSTVPITKFRGATTGYTSGGLKYRGAGTLNAFGSASQTAFYDDMVTRYNSDKPALFATLRDFMKGPAVRDNNAKVIQYTKTHAAHFANAGTILDANYEASSGDDMPASEVNRLPILRTIAIEYLRSQECGDANLDLHQQLIALFPDMMLCDYGIFKPDFGAPWNTLFPGEDFSVPFYAQAYEPYLRDPLSLRP